MDTVGNGTEPIIQHRSNAQVSKLWAAQISVNENRLHVVVIL